MTDKIKPTQDKDNDPTTLSEQPSIQPIVDLGSTTIRNSRGTIHCLTIVGTYGAAEYDKSDKI